MPHKQSQLHRLRSAWSYLTPVQKMSICYLILKDKLVYQRSRAEDTIWILFLAIMAYFALDGGLLGIFAGTLIGCYYSIFNTSHA